MRPRIISVGYALPENSYSQEQLYEILGYKTARVKSIFENSGIERRYLWTIPRGKSWQELTQEYQKAAISLSKDAILDCMDGRPMNCFGCLIFASCTGYSCPGISHHLAAELNLPDNLIHSNLLGQGCEASAPSLARAVDYVIAHDRPALLVSCEPCSCAYFPAPESDLENTVTNCLFGDAAAAVLVGYSEEPYHPEIVDVQSYFNKEYIDYLGFKWADGRLKCVLNKDVPRASGVLVREAVIRMLAKHRLSMDDIKYWAIHPGGVRVLEEIQKNLGIDKRQLSLSYETLREVGNVSSATIIMMAKQLNRVRPPAWGLAVTMGAGAECGAVLLRWTF
jgi:predicted naringenin-chalcone synthase